MELLLKKKQWCHSFHEEETCQSVERNILLMMCDQLYGTDKISSNWLETDGHCAEQSQFIVSFSACMQRPRTLWSIKVNKNRGSVHYLVLHSFGTNVLVTPSSVCSSCSISWLSPFRSLQTMNINQLINNRCVRNGILQTWAFGFLKTNKAPKTQHHHHQKTNTLSDLYT